MQDACSPEVQEVYESTSDLLLALVRLRNARAQGRLGQLSEASDDVREASVRALPLLGMPQRQAVAAASMCALACGDTGALEGLSAFLGSVDHTKVAAVARVVERLAHFLATEHAGMWPACVDPHSLDIPPTLPRRVLRRACLLGIGRPGQSGLEKRQRGESR